MPFGLNTLRNIVRREPKAIESVAKPNMLGKPATQNGRVIPGFKGRFDQNAKINRTGVTQTYATRGQARAAYKAQQPKKPSVISRARTAIGNKFNINGIKPIKPGTVTPPNKVQRAINNIRNKVGTATNINAVKAPKTPTVTPQQPRTPIPQPTPQLTGRRRKRGFSNVPAPKPQPTFLNATTRTTRKRSSAIQ